MQDNSLKKLYSSFMEMKEKKSEQEVVCNVNGKQSIQIDIRMTRNSDPKEEK